MVAEDEAAAWVALRATAGVGDVTGRRLIRSFACPAAVLAARPEVLVRAGFSPTLASALASADLDMSLAEVRRTHAAGARLVPCTDAEYPALLRQVSDAPLYLIARGEFVADGPAVAVVGARHATAYGRAVAARLAEDLAQAGVTVVSGLARGIDAAAHGGALRGGGQTIAVLGSGIDIVYPREHAELAERIAHSGTILSEHPLGAPPLAEHFPARNRIIAGMTHGTVIVEAAARSGSLITARLALEQGREVFAVPGHIDSPLSVGTNHLIQEGAKLVTSLDDILAEIAPALRGRVGTESVAREHGAGGIAGVTEEPLLSLLAGGPVAVDDLIRASGLAPSRVLARVLELELGGILVQLPGKQFQLAVR
jgi:DNA processing protein